MTVERAPDPERDGSESTRLLMNVLAETWSPEDGFASDDEKDEFVELCLDLVERNQSRLETLESETPLTRREARAWTLKRIVDYQQYVLTDEASAAALSMLEAGTEADPQTCPHAIESWITPDGLNELVASAQTKIDEAEALLGAVSFPQREEALHRPQLIWIDRSTDLQLKRRASGEEYRDAVISRLLDKTANRRTLRELLEAYLQARGRENVSQIAIEKLSLKQTSLRITAHTAIKEPRPDVIEETDRISIAGEEYELRFNESSGDPHERGRVTVYAADSILGMDGVPLREGLVAARRAVENIDGRPVVSADD